MSQTGRAPIPSVNPAASQYQGMPQSTWPVISAGGTMSDAWYRFLQTLWLQTSSGTPSTTSLQSVLNIANGAQQAATAAQAAATAAQTTANNAQSSASAAQTAADNAQTSANTANAAVAAETARAEAAETNLQNQINTINARLAAAGIP